MSMGRRLDKEEVVHICNGILLSDFPVYVLTLDINHQPQNKILTPHREVPAREPSHLFFLSFFYILLSYTLHHSGGFMYVVLPSQTMGF